MVFGSRVLALFVIFGLMEIGVFGFFMLRIEVKGNICVVEFG